MLSFFYNTLISTLLIASSFIFFQPLGIPRYPFHSFNKMSSDTRPPESLLRSWLQSQLLSIYGTHQEENDLRALFYATFTENSHIRYNHELISQETYLERLGAANFAGTDASLTWQDSQFIEIPSGGDSEVCKFLLLLSRANLHLGRNNSRTLRCHSLTQIPDSSGPGPKRKSKLFQRKVGKNPIIPQKIIHYYQ